MSHNCGDLCVCVCVCARACQSSVCVCACVPEQCVCMCLGGLCLELQPHFAQDDTSQDATMRRQALEFLNARSDNNVLPKDEVGWLVILDQI